MSTDSEDSSKSDGKWMQGAVKHPGAFKEYCKGKELVDEEGNITQECITEGKNSDDPTIRKRATLAETFQKNLKGDFLTFDELEEYQEKLDNAQGLYEKDGKLVFQNDMGEQFELDFDINKFMEKKINQKNNEQVYKSSFSEPPATKQNDESKTMSIESKSQDTTNDAKEKEELKEKEKPKKVEVCEKELDMLRTKAKKFDTMDKVIENITALEEKAKSLNELEAKLEKDLKEKETKIATEKENLRKARIKKLATDFQMSEDEFKNDTMEELDKWEPRLDKMIRKPKGNANEIQLDFEPAPQSDFQAKKNALREKYKIKVVK